MEWDLPSNPRGVIFTTVLVIGGSGFIGSEVIRVLSAQGVETLGYDLVYTNITDPKRKWVRGDILDLEALQRSLFEYEVDSIVHLVGLPAIDNCERSPHFSFLLNVVSVQNTLEAMRMADIKKIVFASSATVYGNRSDHPLRESDTVGPANIYGRHKLMAEQSILAYASSYGINGMILRLFNVYGGDPTVGKDVLSIFIRRALAEEPLELHGPNKFRDFVHVGDVAEAFSRVVTREDVQNLTLNIASGKETTLKQIATIVASHYPRSIVRELETTDDGTGLVADVSLAREKLDFAARDPLKGIEGYVGKYSTSAEARIRS